MSKQKNGNSKKILLVKKRAFLCYDEIYKNNFEDEKRIKRIMSSYQHPNYSVMAKQ